MEDPKDQRPVILCEYSHAMVACCKLEQVQTGVETSVESAWFQRLKVNNFIFQQEAKGGDICLSK